MHLGILRTDAVRPEWVDAHGEYPDMFERVLKSLDPTISFTTWNTEAGVLPDSTDAAEGFLITGSKSSVYDDKDWIRRAEDFVRKCHAHRQKLVGICFGHQLVANALGGAVEKSAKGWGVGIQKYKLLDSPFGSSDSDEFCLLASHQDQVTLMPPGAKLIATSDHCEVAAQLIGDHILTFQGHPEFTSEYSKEIMTFRREMIGETRVLKGLASLKTGVHEGERVAGWMLKFFSGQIGS